MTRNFYVKSAAFSLILTVPLLPAIGIYFQSAWLTPIVVFIVFPIAGLILGGDHSVLPADINSKIWLNRYYYWLPLAFVPIWIGNLAWGANLLAARTFSGWQLGGLLFSLAITSAFATCVAHELQHRSGRFDRSVARIVMAICGYGHLLIEHLHHHVTVGDSEIGGTPRMGEASYSFVVRNVMQGARNSGVNERRRLAAGGLPWWNNRIFQDYGLALFVAIAFWTLWSGWGLAIFVAQAAFAIFAIEMITYIQHYGVVREPHEKIAPQIAWSHNCWLTNCITLNITHHSEHHMNPGKPYYKLSYDPLAPRLPACYFVMFVSALFPPVWRWIMDRRCIKTKSGSQFGMLTAP